MIVTITPNPAVDVALSAGRFASGAINRCALDSLAPGGKGVNVSRVVKRLGQATEALGFAGGLTGELVRTLLAEEGIAHEFIDVGGLTRMNLAVTDQSSGALTRINLPGPAVEPHQWAMLERSVSLRPPGLTMTLGGWVPPGVDPLMIRDLADLLVRRGAQLILDLAGSVLATALQARPALAKPNIQEAEEALAHPVADRNAAIAAAHELRALGAERVVLSRGAQGAIGVGPEGAFEALPPRITAQSTIGSGDSMVAGIALVLSEGGSFGEALRLGTAAGAATASSPGVELCQPDEVLRLRDGVIVRELHG